MLYKCEEGTRYIYRKQFESALVPNGFSVANARRDERESRESRPGGETRLKEVSTSSGSVLKQHPLPPADRVYFWCQCMFAVRLCL